MLESPSQISGLRSIATPSPKHWSKPPIGFYKFNFDGASKGNLGATGFGGAIKDNNGDIKLVLYGTIGHDTNNVTELSRLLEGDL